MRPDQQDPAQEDWISRLCPECGLCCNGVLFADVRLVKGDDAVALASKGLKLGRCGGKSSFEQPCSCFDGRGCKAYDERPTRCRDFHCHTLKQAVTGAIVESEALGRIRNAKRDAETVWALLSALGQTDEHLPLTTRYQVVMSQPIDLSREGDSAERRGELMMAVNRLMNRLHRDFLVQTGRPHDS